MDNKVDKELIAFLKLTESIKTSLQDGRMEPVIDLLHKRSRMLETLQSDSFVTALTQIRQCNDGQTRKTRNIIDQINKIDKRNREEIKRKIAETSGMMSELNNGQDAVRKLRGVSHAPRKHIVDFLY